MQAKGSGQDEESDTGVEGISQRTGDRTGRLCIAIGGAG